ncbi:MAG: tRNA pseudouridine(54/55) synthase Pus10 [Methanobacterium sp.]
MESQITEYALKIMEMSHWNLCDHCLGRCFSKMVEGQDNKHRGKIVRESLNMENNNALRSDKCYICGNIFEVLENEIIEKIINRIEKENVEFSTFLVGSRLYPEILKKEENIHKKMELDVENIKKEINRETGKKLHSKIEKEVDFDSPDIIIMTDLVKNKIDIQIKSIFIEGRYRKLIRGIPQTKWPCRECKGKGCPYCGYTGQMYPESVELLISPPATSETAGKSSKFHGAGREDIDVRMLGDGRPFVLEIKEPHVRNLDLEFLQDKINKFANGKVEVQDLKFVGKGRKSEIKCSSTDTYKVYKALVKVEGEIKEDELDILQSIKIIKQRTPIRVSHRRADKIRVRKIEKITTNWINSRNFEIIIMCEGGLYIKELISGDLGRSKPSISEILGTPALCAQLDVLEVKI